MPSLYLNRLKSEERSDLTAKLHEMQKGSCFICGDAIDLVVHDGALDIDHIEPIHGGGKDDPSNFALTHDTCNRSKQASDLRVARVLARFDRIREKVKAEDRGPNLSDVLGEYGGAKHELHFQIEDGTLSYALSEVGDPGLRKVPIYEDALTGLRYFFAEMPIAYLHHDDRINPRSIGGNLGRLVEEFHKRRPQLHVGLAWLKSDGGAAPLRVFDGQHKMTAQVLLGAEKQPVRVFIDPDPDVLLTTNTNAGTTLRQVAFDKSVQRRLGSALFSDRLERFRQERNLDADVTNFSEADLVSHFRGESREMKRYILDNQRNAVTHSPDNKLKDFIDPGGRGQELPLSYNTVEKSFYSFFIYNDVLSTPLDYRAEEGLNPRELEIKQIVGVMNVIAEEIYLGQFDPGIGTGRIENKVQKGKDIPEPHLRAFRMSKEEILYVWLGYVGQIVQTHFVMQGHPVDQARLFQEPFPVPLWEQIRAYIVSLKGLPAWINKDLSSTVFGGKQNYEYWRTVFKTGKSPQGHQVLVEPLNLLTMIQGGASAPDVASALTS